jgi:hypothetical protein
MDVLGPVLHFVAIALLAAAVLVQRLEIRDLKDRPYPKVTNGRLYIQQDVRARRRR